MNDPLEYIFASLDKAPRFRKRCKKYKRLQIIDDGKISRRRLIKNRAKVMRKKPTNHESILWSRLKLIKGFIPQYIVGSFIIDFALPQIRLGIEVDGNSHRGTGKHKDQWRTEKLNRSGWLILRFWNEEVENNLPAVMSKINSVCHQIWPTRFK